MPKTRSKTSVTQEIAMETSSMLAESPSKKRAASQSSEPETIVLLDDEDDKDAATMESLRSQYEAATMKAFADDKKKKSKPSPLKAASPAGLFSRMLRSASKNKSQGKNTNEPAAMDTTSGSQNPGAAAAARSVPDAIDVDDISSSCSNDPSSIYRRALGPLRFDFIDSFRHHHFLNEKPQANFQKIMPSLYKELLEYRLNLPSEVSGSIFVRALESRMDLVRALITGPEDTPYANGCFLFDIYLTDYPKKAPKVQFLTTGQGKVRFNPNLYNCGKVCLSLLGTWSGPGWIANKSTLLQVLVSIQGLILVAEPYYNEPGYEKHKNQKASDAYTSRIRQYTLQHAIFDPLDMLVQKKTLDYPEFQSVMIRHFCQRAQAINVMMDEWIAKDKTLKATADKIRTHLQSLVAEYGQDSSVASEVVDGEVEDSKPAALKSPPEVFEIDD